MSGKLAIELIDAGLPLGKATIDAIRAEANEDLLKNNKYSQGKKEYLDTNTLRRMLNEAFDFKWSWEILNYEVRDDGGTQYASVYGRLHLPGVGFRDAFGSAKIESGGKKDNSAIFASASSYAFKNAVKQTGFASNLFDDNFDEDLWYDDPLEEPAPKKQEAKKEQPKAAPKEEKKAEPKQDAKKPPVEEDDEEESFSEKQKADMIELREIHKIKTNKELVGLFQIWDKDIKSLGEITPKRLDEFLKFYDDNEDLFEDFDPAEVA